MVVTIEYTDVKFEYCTPEIYMFLMLYVILINLNNKKKEKQNYKHILQESISEMKNMNIRHRTLYIDICPCQLILIMKKN